MQPHVEITFDCYPLRSIARFDVPIDAAPEQQALGRRIRQAAAKHGLHNTYYLCNARCIFRLTNHDETGMIEFGFEGTVLTDAKDQHTLQCDLAVELQAEVCPWLTAAAAAWLADTVREAVKIEFDRYIAAGDLHRTIARIERLQTESDAGGGFLGMGL
jgi:hypothetical protein